MIAAVTARPPGPGSAAGSPGPCKTEPGLLTGAGAGAPVPSVLRLIGSSATPAPPVSSGRHARRCGRVIHLHRRIGGQWSCRNCAARSRSQPCARCGAVRQAATRDEQGRPLCPHCLITDPANQETCTGCGRRRPGQRPLPDGPLCPACAPVKTMTCSICGRHAPRA